VQIFHAKPQLRTELDDMNNDRRSLSKTLWPALAICMLSVIPLSLSAAPQRPNIVVIMCDDAGFADFGFQGGVAKTPYLDRLADEGVIFTRAHSNGRCWPTRQSFMTGLNPQLADDGGPDLGPDALTLPEYLGLAGYANYMVGKWHLGMGNESNPKNTPFGRGFDAFSGALAGANQPTKEKLIEHAEQFKEQGKTPMMLYRGDRMLEYEEIPDDFYETFSWTNEGLEMVRQTPPDQPFFLFMSYTAPHWPIQPLDDYVALYDGMFDGDWEVMRREILERQIQKGIFPEGYPLAPMPDVVIPITEDPQRERNVLNTQRYYATISELDKGIEQLIEGLKEMGRADNTLVIFISDNGGEPLLGGPHRALLSNTPFAGGKVSQFEGGTATPFIAWWPGKVPAGTVNTEHEIRLEDFMATFVDLAGAPFPENYEGRRVFPPQGRSFLPAMEDPEFDGGPRIWVWEHDGQSSVWMEPWKAHFTERKHPIHKKFTDTSLAGWSLFNLENHRVEMDNLAEENPEKLRELMQVWQAWAESVRWSPSYRWGMNLEWPEGLQYEGTDHRDTPDPATYDPSANPVGKVPAAWTAGRN